MESIISIVAAMPPKSKHRAKLTNFLITGLWDSLEHPPISHHGPKFQYRTADGSYNVSLGLFYFLLLFSLPSLATRRIV